MPVRGKKNGSGRKWPRCENCSTATSARPRTAPAAWNWWRRSGSPALLMIQGRKPAQQTSFSLEFSVVVTWRGTVIIKSAGEPAEWRQLQEEVARLRRELREGEERTRVLVDASLDAVVTMDAQGRATGWNAQAEVMFGW